MLRRPRSVILLQHRLDCGSVLDYDLALVGMLRLISGLCLLLHVLPVLLAKGFIAFTDLPFSAESFAYSMNNVRDFQVL